ncbi:MAG: Chromosome segregation DNA-binding protein [Cypionkella sp.]|uniref:ParB/RepB/Spo0J family partition protein n=1 Tax=Cypionkella sp. TaxID=2811411 RepID=UPI002611C0DB|nr:ParB/RepB/Spo0J family partition protein [Cypionkella sp.]MDB5658589.1 Chromosome segregation DNA-binding protein [Cypionkella sp.]MDB5663731.1 Chromosome segregation DNA-binding protein [Cypionkella sp.]
MDKKFDRRGLNRGLSALMADVNLDVASALPDARRSELSLPIEKIVPNPDQPRRDFPAQALRELADSLLQKGVIQPLIVRKKSNEDLYEIVAGERRWRAAQMAQLHELPVIIREFSDSEVLEIAIIENIQRAELNSIDEAFAYRQLMDKFGHTQEKIAEALSRSRSHIANLLRLLTLPHDVQEMVKSGTLSAGHARALITTANATELALQVVGRGLSVRDTEELVRKSAIDPAKRRALRQRGEKDADTKALELDLSANLHMGVQIDHLQGGDGGKVTISYRSLEQLDLLCRVLSAIPRDAEF